MGTCFHKNDSVKNKTVRVDINKPLEKQKTNISSQDQGEDDVKFDDMEEIEGDIYVGEGVKKMKAYKCDLKIDELEKLRTEFWDSKKKHRNIWKALKLAAVTDHIKSSTIIHQHNLTPVNGSMNLCVDSNNIYFRIPNFCIQYPYFEKELLPEYQETVKEKLQIFLYDLYDNKKYSIDLSSNVKGEELKMLYFDLANINPNEYKIRLLFGGAEIKDDQHLYQHKLHDEFTIQIIKNKLNQEQE